MNERAIVFCENMLRERNTFFVTEHHLPVAEAAQQAEQIFAHRNSSGATIFRFALLHALAGNSAAGMLDDDIALITAGHDHV